MNIQTLFDISLKFYNLIWQVFRPLFTHYTDKTGPTVYRAYIHGPLRRPTNQPADRPTLSIYYLFIRRVEQQILQNKTISTKLTTFIILKDKVLK